jgi:predicted acetyltransferase
MELVLPDVRLRDSYIACERELQADGRASPRDIAAIERAFDAFVAEQQARREDRNLAPGKAPCTELWIVSAGRVVGRANIHHRLTPALEVFGGNIGYSIRPSERGKGYATKALALALARARKLGITEALLTCADDNIASIRVIEKNGGRLVDRVPREGTTTPTRRYRISTSA